MTGYLNAWLEQNTQYDPQLISKLLFSLLVLLVLWLVHWGILSLIRRRIEDVRLRYAWQKAFGYIALVLALIFLGSIWLEGFRNAATILGLLTAGLAIALKDLVTGFVGWLFILISRPFRVGDRIQVGAISGDVIDLRIFQFTLLEIGNWVEADQSTGRVIHVPNGRVFSEPIANYETGFRYIWNELSITITLDSNWKQAKQILQRIVDERSGNLSEMAQQRVKEAANRFMIYYSNLTPTVYTSVKNNGILLTVRYLCEPRQRRPSADAIWEDILEEFGQYEDIRIGNT